MLKNNRLVDPKNLLKITSIARQRKVSRTVIYKEIAEKKLDFVLIDGTPHIIAERTSQ